MSAHNITDATGKGKSVTSGGRQATRRSGPRKHASRRPERYDRRRAAVRECREARKRCCCAGPPASLLRRFINPLRDAISKSLEKEQARSWFPVLSMLPMIVCGLLYHLFGLSSMRAAFEKTNYLKLPSVGKISRSTYSDAINSPLRLRVLRQVFQHLLLSFAHQLPAKFSKFRHLAAIDSTILHCAPSDLWAKYRKAVNACKAHLCFDISKGIPHTFVLSAARIHDSKYFECFLKKGWTYVVDRAYNVYSLFDDMIELGIFFVTRLKVDAVYRIVETKRVKRKHKKRGIISDQIIRLGAGTAEMVNNLRLVTFLSEEGKVLHFLTNRFDLEPTSVAAMYRARWAIELFIKFFKRTLRGVRLIGRSEIGAEVHVLLALITDVLLKCLARVVKAWQKVSRHVPAQFLRAVREHLLCKWTQSLAALLIAAFPRC